MSRYLTKCLSYCKTEEERASRIASRRALEVFLADMEKPGSQSQSSSLAPPRLSPSIQPPNYRFERPSRPLPSSPRSTKNKLSRPSQTTGSGHDGKRASSKAVHKRDVAIGTRVLLESIPRPQAVRRLQVSHRSIGTQHVPSQGVVFDGHSKTHQSSGAGRYVGDLSGSLRRVPSHPHGREVSGISMLPGREQAVHVSGPPIRASHGPVGVHRGSQTDQDMVVVKTEGSVSVSGRLAKPVSQTFSSFASNTGAGKVVRSSWFTSQPQEVRVNPKATIGFPGGDSGLHVPHSFRDGRPEEPGMRSDLSGQSTSGPAVLSGRITVGSTDSHLPDGTSGTSSSEMASNRGNQSHSQGPSSADLGTDYRSGVQVPPMVDVTGQMDTRGSLSPSLAAGNSLHRCVSEGLGHNLRGGLVERVLEQRGSHQLVRTQSDSNSSSGHEVTSSEQDSLLLHRQHHGGGVSQSSRGDPLLSSTALDIQNLEVGGAAESDDHSASHSGATKCASGLGVQEGSGSPSRVVADPTSLGLDGESVSLGWPVDRSIRQSVEPPASQVRLSLPGQSSDLNRRDGGDMATGGDSVRIPSPISHVEVSTAPGEGGQSEGITSDSVVPSGQVDTSASLPPSGVVDAIPSGSSPTPPTSLAPHPGSSVLVQPAPNVYSAEWLSSQGFSQRVIERIMGARALSTQKHYKSQWDVFAGWSVAKKIDPFNASLPLLAEFFDFLFREREVSVRTIKNYRSAIAFYWRTQIGFVIPEDDKVIKDLFKSYKRERPIPHKHVTQWDIGYVLSFFSSGRFKDWNSLSDKDLTLKTVFLFALASGKRRSEIHAITKGVRWIQGEFRKVELRPSADFISKTQLACDIGKLRPFTISSLDELAGPEGKDDKLLCPVRSLRYYLQRSSEYRSEEQQKLFISYRRGMAKDIRPMTISAYIREAIVLAYASDPGRAVPSQIKAHSVRHVATSLQALKCFSLDDLLKAGAWSTPNVFISFYLQEFSVDSLTNLSHLGGFVAAGARI